jgi:ADP-ribose pyrophosphatase YjhB (NUDIX family)
MQYVRFVAVNFLYRLQVLRCFLLRPHTQGVKCVITCNDKFLLVRPAYAHRRFTFPGGGVKRGEKAVEAAVRELFEETGVMVTQLTWFGSYAQEIEYKHDTVQCYYGAMEAAEAHADNFEIAEVTWFSRADVPLDCSPSVHKIFTLYDARA